jgi:hypothetical protein
MVWRLALVSFFFAACATAPPPARQNPSPMTDSTREHRRVEERPVEGRRFAVEGLVPKPVEVLVTPAAASAPEADLVIHFHGASWLPMQEAEATGLPLVIAVVNLGAGSRRYSGPFDDPRLFEQIRERIASQSPRIRHLYLSAFSAGYGAVRAILRQQPPGRVAGVLLLDGLHTSYVPDEKPIAEGGALDLRGLEPFVGYARRAAAGEVRFVITHSEIFPGTFASTTETADHLLAALGARRVPLLKWGPVGMQQLSEAATGRFVLLGFAGNTAPDHVDHLHGYGTFLRLLAEVP